MTRSITVFDGSLRMEPKAPIRLFESHEEMLHVGLWWRFERSIMEIKPYANEGAPSIVLVVVPRWIANWCGRWRMQEYMRDGKVE
jgi:hypothetical protein